MWQLKTIERVLSDRWVAAYERGYNYRAGRILKMRDVRYEENSRPASGDPFDRGLVDASRAFAALSDRVCEAERRADVAEAELERLRKKILTALGEVG